MTEDHLVSPADDGLSVSKNRGQGLSVRPLQPAAVSIVGGLVGCWQAPDQARSATSLLNHFTPMNPSRSHVMTTSHPTRSELHVGRAELTRFVREQAERT